MKWKHGRMKALERCKMYDAFAHVQAAFAAFCDFLHYHLGFALINICVLMINLLVILSVRKCSSLKTNSNTIKESLHNAAVLPTKRKIRTKMRSPQTVHGTNAYKKQLVQTATKNNKKRFFPAAARCHERPSDPDETAFQHTDYETAPNDLGFDERLCKDSDVYDETLDEVTWGFDTSGSPVIPHQYGNRRGGKKNLSAVSEECLDTGKKRSRKKGDSDAPREKQRRTRDKQATDRNLREKRREKKYSTPRSPVTMTPHKIFRRKKGQRPEENHPSGKRLPARNIFSAKGTAPTTPKEESPKKHLERAQVEGERLLSPNARYWPSPTRPREMPAIPRQTSSDSDHEFHEKPAKTDVVPETSDQDLPDNRSETSLVCKRDSWIWFSPETRPSVENFASRQRKFQSEDPRVAALAAEIRRQEELNKDIERTAESLIDSSSQSSKNYPNFPPWRTKQQSDWSGGKYRLAKSRGRERARISPYSRPQERYALKSPRMRRLLPSSSSDLKEEPLSPLTKKLLSLTKISGRDVSPTRWNAHIREKGLSKHDRKGGPAVYCFPPNEYFSPIRADHMTTPSSSSSSPRQTRKQSSQSLLSPRSQPVFCYNSPAAEIINRSSTPGRYSPLYDNSTLMTSRTCSPSTEDARLAELINSRSTQTTPQLHKYRGTDKHKHSYSSKRLTRHPKDSMAKPNDQFICSANKKHHKQSRSSGSYWGSPSSKLRKASDSSAMVSMDSPREITFDKNRRHHAEMNKKRNMTVRSFQDSKGPLEVRVYPKRPAQMSWCFGKGESPTQSKPLKISTSPEAMSIEVNIYDKKPVSPFRARLYSKHRPATSSPENLTPKTKQANLTQLSKVSSLISLHQSDGVRANWVRSPPVTFSTGDSESESLYRDKPDVDTSFRQVLICKEVNTTVHKLLFDTEQSSSSLSPSGKIKIVTINKPFEPPENAQEPVSPNKEPPSDPQKKGHRQLNTISYSTRALTSLHNWQKPESLPAERTETSSKQPKGTEPALVHSNCSNEQQQQPGKSKRTNIYARDYYLGKRVALKKQQQQQEAEKKPQESAHEVPSSRWKKTITSRLSSKTSSPSCLSAEIYENQDHEINKNRYTSDLPGGRDSDIHTTREADRRTELQGSAAEGNQNYDTTNKPTQSSDSSPKEASSTTESPLSTPHTQEGDTWEQTQSLVCSPEQKLRVFNEPGRYPYQEMQQESPDGLKTYRSEPPRINQTGLQKLPYPGEGPNLLQKHDGRCISLLKNDSYHPVLQNVRKSTNVPGGVNLTENNRRKPVRQVEKLAGTRSTNNSSSNLPYLRDRTTDKCKTVHPSAQTVQLYFVTQEAGERPPQVISESMGELSKKPHIDLFKQSQLCTEPFTYCSNLKSDIKTPPFADGTILPCLTETPTMLSQFDKIVLKNPEVCTNSYKFCCIGHIPLKDRDSLPNISGQNKEKIFSGPQIPTFKSKLRNSRCAGQQRRHCDTMSSCHILVTDQSLEPDKLLPSNIDLPPTSSDEEEEPDADMASHSHPARDSRHVKAQAAETDPAGMIYQCAFSAPCKEYTIQNASNPDSGYDESLSDKVNLNDPSLLTGSCPAYYKCDSSPKEVEKSADKHADSRVAVYRALSSSSDESHTSEDFARKSRTSNDGDSEHESFTSITNEDVYFHTPTGLPFLSFPQPSTQHLECHTASDHSHDEVDNGRNVTPVASNKHNECDTSSYCVKAVQKNTLNEWNTRSQQWYDQQAQQNTPNECSTRPQRCCSRTSQQNVPNECDTAVQLFCGQASQLNAQNECDTTSQRCCDQAAQQNSLNKCDTTSPQFCHTAAAQSHALNDEIIDGPSSTDKSHFLISGSTLFKCRHESSTHIRHIASNSSLPSKATWSFPSLHLSETEEEETSSFHVKYSQSFSLVSTSTQHLRAGTCIPLGSSLTTLESFVYADPAGEGKADTPSAPGSSLPRAASPWDESASASTEARAETNYSDSHSNTSLCSLPSCTLNCERSAGVARECRRSPDRSPPLVHTVHLPSSLSDEDDWEEEEEEHRGDILTRSHRYEPERTPVPRSSECKDEVKYWHATQHHPPESNAVTHVCQEQKNVTATLDICDREECRPHEILFEHTEQELNASDDNYELGNRAPAACQFVSSWTKPPEKSEDDDGVASSINVGNKNAGVNTSNICDSQYKEPPHDAPKHFECHKPQNNTVKLSEVPGNGSLAARTFETTDCQTNVSNVYHCEHNIRSCSWERTANVTVESPGVRLDTTRTCKVEDLRVQARRICEQYKTDASRMCHTANYDDNTVVRVPEPEEHISSDARHFGSEDYTLNVRSCTECEHDTSRKSTAGICKRPDPSVHTTRLSNDLEVPGFSSDKAAATKEYKIKSSQSHKEHTKDDIRKSADINPRHNRIVVLAPEHRAVVTRPSKSEDNKITACKKPIGHAARCNEYDLVITRRPKREERALNAVKTSQSKDAIASSLKNLFKEPSIRLYDCAGQSKMGISREGHRAHVTPAGDEDKDSGATNNEVVSTKALRGSKVSAPSQRVPRSEVTGNDNPMCRKKRLWVKPTFPSPYCMSEAQKRAMISNRSVAFADLLKRF